MTQKITEFNHQFLDLHLKVLRGLINGKNFNELRARYKIEMDDLDYMNLATGKLLTFNEGKLVGAYPISPTKTQYKVVISNVGTGYAMCAIDALGVAYTFMEKTSISSFFIDTKDQFTVLIDPRDDSYQINSNTDEIYVSYTSPNKVSNVALEQCPSINFYQSKDKIPEDLQVITFGQALESAKKQFRQEAIVRCVLSTSDRPSTSIEMNIPDKCNNCC